MIFKRACLGSIYHMAVSRHWGPFGGCPYNKSPICFWGSILGPVMSGNSHIVVKTGSCIWSDSCASSGP